MARKPQRNRYMIRTLSYYQSQGGIYNDLITYLTNLRQQPKYRGIPGPAELLNDACFVLDYSQTMSDDEAAKYIDEQSEFVRELIHRMEEGQKQQQAAMTLQAIIDYILQHKQYQFVNQIINMLKDMVGRTCSEEEYQQILAAEQAVMDNSKMEIVNKNEMHNCNVFPGIANNPTVPQK